MPQIFVQGELIGGSDIVLEMLQDGSLQEMFDEGRSA
jgi:glutaredoxin-related protein